MRTEQQKINTKNKGSNLATCMLSTLLYRTEMWNSRQKKYQLTRFCLQCPWKVMNIKWRDKVNNTEALQCAKLPPTMKHLFSSIRLRCLGDAPKMNDTHISIQILHGKLQEGRTPKGEGRLTYKDVCWSSMFFISQQNLE